MNWLRQHPKAAWFSLSAVVAVLLVAGLVYFLHFHRNHKANANGRQKEAGPVRVRVIYPKEGGVERLVSRPGDVRSFEYADLYAKVSGPLAKQTVDIGSRVQKGQTLAEVDAPEYAADVKKASADVNKAKADADAAAARVDKAKADLDVAQSQYEQSKADVGKAKAMLVLRKIQYKRFEGLVASKSIQQELLDEKEQARTAAEESLFAAQKAVNTAQANIVAAKAGVEQAKADLANAKAQIGVAQAYLERAQVFVGYTQITSPYTGVITRRTFHNGDFVQNASTGDKSPVLSVARTDKMRVIIYVPDLAVPYLHEGDTVQLQIDALPDRHFPGKIARLSSAESLESRTMRAEVDMENPDGLLKDGMYGRMVIHLGREKGLRVPSTCLFGNEKDEVRSVYVVRDGEAHEVKVRVGIDDGIEATVREGLETSEQIVAERVSGLTNGSRVEVIGIGLERAKIRLHKGEDKESGGKEGSKGKQSGGKESSVKQPSSGKPSATSNFSDAKESERSNRRIDKERKEFESSGGKKDSQRKK